ncbi:hypothetical protein SAMN02982929_07188 [Saccharopolyspora kobensis]|uniref:Uncharacterized protein n=1 Tax=Saccharopolyspora kobensis TaxID=146035 RepID=A0A1H6ELG2_9PSEU|nr:hypothetical protein [Saccharopolyspora kobensis]SEG98697.1 hypothetical protein SAMN02982929_07188 [Saccharopolyspora kobensis]SFD23737.1 hypothetical protein SAMN05216506_103181 [Saccharopolyspora kobensis]
MLSVETEYGGYRFRSRLEARWAVAFDELGIVFEYEPEGVKVPLRFRTSWYPRAAVMRYLPDFYLPEFNLWAEVKGRMGAQDDMKTLNGAAELSDHGSDVLVLGDVFRQPRGQSRRPWRLTFSEGELVASAWPETAVYEEELIASESDPQAIGHSIDLLRGYVCDEPLPKEYREAFRAAQRARFEHGESG